MEEQKDPQKVGEEVASNAAQKFGLFCLIALLVVLGGSLLLLPFLKYFSYEFVDGFATFFGWATPCLLGAFVACSSFCYNTAEKNIKGKK